MGARQENKPKYSRKEQERYEALQQQFREGPDLLSANKMLERAARLFPHTTVIECMTQPMTSISYQELYAAASRVSAQLTAEGIGVGDRVLILYENSIQFYIAYFGVWQTGAIVAPLNSFLNLHEVEHIIQDATPRAILVSNELAPKLGNGANNIRVITESELTSITNNSALTTTYQTRSHGLDDCSVILYTSGTTGFPKGVMLSSRSIILNVLQGVSRLTLTAHERLYCALPLFHSFTQNSCVWAPILLGATVILIPKISRTALLAGLVRKPTVIVGVPGLYALFCRFKDISFEHVRYFISGGDPLVDKIRMYFALLYGRSICNGYGLSETSPLIAVDVDDAISSTHTIGAPMVDTEIEIRDGDPVGTLWVKGPQLMLGYYNAPEATAKVIVNGWLNTGDLARIDEQGKIVICGRERDLIAHKGIKIYPQEVENILMSHPEVMVAAVVGAMYNNIEYPVAYVTLKSEISPEELQAFCAERLAPYKVPRTIKICKTLPMTSTGKVDKKELRKELATEQDAQDRGTTE